MSNYVNKSSKEMNIEEIRKKVRETTEMELIRDAIRARKFSGLSTLLQGLDLIDFALQVQKVHVKENSMRSYG